MPTVCALMCSSVDCFHISKLVHSANMTFVKLPDKLVVLTFYCRGFLSKVEAPISNQDLMGNLQGAIILIRLGLDYAIGLGLDFDQAGNQ